MFGAAHEILTFILLTVVVIVEGVSGAYAVTNDDITEKTPHPF